MGMEYKLSIVPGQEILPGPFASRGYRAVAMEAELDRIARALSGAGFLGPLIPWKTSPHWRHYRLGPAADYLRAYGGTHLLLFHHQGGITAALESGPDPCRCPDCLGQVLQDWAGALALYSENNLAGSPLSGTEPELICPHCAAAFPFSSLIAAPEELAAFFGGVAPAPIAAAGQPGRLLGRVVLEVDNCHTLPGPEDEQRLRSLLKDHLGWESPRFRITVI